SALVQFQKTRQPFCGPTDPRTAGNGSLMRLAPVPMFYGANPIRAIEAAADSSRTTHAAPTAVDACRYMAGLIVGALGGASKSELLGPRSCGVPGYWSEFPLVPEIAEIAAGSFKLKQPPTIQG